MHDNVTFQLNDIPWGGSASHTGTERHTCAILFDHSRAWMTQRPTAHVWVNKDFA